MDRIARNVRAFLKAAQTGVFENPFGKVEEAISSAGSAQSVPTPDTQAANNAGAALSPLGAQVKREYDESVSRGGPYRNPYIPISPEAWRAQVTTDGPTLKGNANVQYPSNPSNQESGQAAVRTARNQQPRPVNIRDLQKGTSADFDEEGPGTEELARTKARRIPSDATTLASQ